MAALERFTAIVSAPEPHIDAEAERPVRGRQLEGVVVSDQGLAYNIGHIGE